MKRTIPTAALVVMPNCGHTINLEEPAAFNAHVAAFFCTVDAGAWRRRDRAPWRASILDGSALIWLVPSLRRHCEERVARRSNPGGIPLRPEIPCSQ